MTNIDPAIVEALGAAIYADAEGVDLDEQVAVLSAAEDAIAPLIADAVKAAEAEGFKRGAAAVREAVEEVAERWDDGDPYGDQFYADNIRAAIAATEDQP